MTSRNVFQEFEEGVTRKYEIPSFYVPYHEVYKEGSSSTPVRLIINSSLQYKGKIYLSIER